MHDIEEGLSDIYDSISKKFEEASEQVEKAVMSGKAKLEKAVHKSES
jgi:hypothetical protein